MKMKKTIGIFALLPFALFGVKTVDLGHDDISVVVESDRDVVDPTRDFMVTVTLSAPKDKAVKLPDLRDRFRGFRIAEDFTLDPVVSDSGVETTVSNWRLVPEPEAKRYGIRPFVVGDFCTKPVDFDPPAARDPVTGGMEVEPKKDFPPLTFKLVGMVCLCLALVCALVAGLWMLIRKIRTMLKVRRMSPIERAFWELENLVRKGLPGRGFYKDFYVELTMVVRRYVERKYGVKAPNMTTQEFLVSFERSDELRNFLESADLVKFAGVEATPQMADDATVKAREYLNVDRGRIVEGNEK